ncbi:MAG: hypothetical protein L3J95_00445 [Thermoplasmata archaeon]|nr:hypothetical protein [Thermoplasmata archaeon]MCI4358889.1 hypothetical protein [Thermoplasmata archaeon]
MNETRLGLAAIVSMAVLAAMIVPAFAPVASAGPLTPSNGGAPRQWAYGGQRWVNTTVTFDNGSFSSRAYFGEHVVITETNTTATTREVQAVRTIGESFFADFCRPDCSHPNSSANLSLRAWQQLSAFVNLTTNATVYETTTVSVNGTSVRAIVAVPALGVLNASSSARGQLNESYSIVRGTHVGAKGTLDVSRRASMGVSFQPALGLVPWNASAGQVWNSTSTFSAHGGWNDSYSFSNVLNGIATSASGTSSGNVSHRGVESVRGADIGNLTLRNGAVVDVIVLAFSGPFEFAEGLFVTTVDADLFGGGSVGWNVHAVATAQATTSTLDVAVDHASRTARMQAVSTSAALGTTALGSASVQGTSGPGGSSPNPPAASESIQEQPESPQAAQQASQCLIGGCTSPASSSGLLALAVGVSVTVAAVGAVALVLARRPRRPMGTNGTNPGG